jgi:hypothetical protein
MPHIKIMKFFRNKSVKLVYREDNPYTKAVEEK